MNLFFGLIITAFAVLAAPNSILHPSWGEVLNAGETFTIEWSASSYVKKVNLVLRAGGLTGADNLTTLYTIASNVDNTGRYDWDIQSTQATNTDYTISIIDADNPTDQDMINFSPYFTILKEGEGITSSGASSSRVASTSASASTSAASSVSATNSSSTATSQASSSPTSSSTTSSADASTTDSAQPSDSAAAASSDSGAASTGEGDASSRGSVPTSRGSGMATAAAVASSTESSSAATVSNGATSFSLSFIAAALGAICLVA